MIGLVLVGVGAAYGYRIGQFGLLSAGAGGVLNIKAFLGEMEDRERRAFDVGQQFGRAVEDVPHLTGPRGRR